MDVKKPGDIVEGFDILQELGRGAASIIYLARDPKSKQIWALKHVIRETEKDQRFLDQAEAEYAIASRLDHSRIRKIVRMIKKRPSLLSMAANELWLVMELVDGASLEREPPRTFEDAAYIFEQVADALHHMHTQGYVHADMKPNNIVVDQKLGVKIIDLGQSCKLNTVKERIQGTPDYIAPEQVHRRPITAKTDIYNLGATMYWVLTRQHVPTALGRGDSLLGSVDDTLIPKPKPPSVINPRVPELFEKLILDCVEVEPAKRPDTMGEVATRLGLIRTKLAAEAVMRKTGEIPRPAPDEPSLPDDGIDEEYPPRLGGSTRPAPPGAAPPGVGSPGLGSHDPRGRR